MRCHVILYDIDIILLSFLFFFFSEFKLICTLCRDTVKWKVECHSRNGLAPSPRATTDQNNRVLTKSPSRQSTSPAPAPASQPAGYHPKPYRIDPISCPEEIYRSESWPSKRPCVGVARRRQRQQHNTRRNSVTHPIYPRTTTPRAERIFMCHCGFPIEVEGIDLTR